MDTPDTIVILTEQGLSTSDAARILALHEGETLRYRLLVPHDPHRSLLVDVLDDLSLLDMRKLLTDLRRRDRSPQKQQADATERLRKSLESMRSHGVEAEGEITADDPLAALGEAAGLHRAREVVIVTRPHAVEDTFHTDWASVARSTLGIPVLHLYAETGYVGR